MKVAVKFIIIICLLSLFCGYCAFDAYYIAPSRFTVRYETISSELIDEQLDGVSILYFSDLDYGTFMDEERAVKLFARINGLSPDIVIFGGDLFDEACTPNQKMKETLRNLLKQIDAPLGKFAVMGDFDERDDAFKKSVEELLTEADFEVLNNQVALLHNTGSASITLVGLDNSLTGNPDISEAFASVSRSTYVLAVVHTPDDAEDLPDDIVDYCLAGHSHGGQVYWFFGAYYTPEGAVNYFRGKNTVASSFTLDITTGTGTTGSDIRLFTDPEIVVYHLAALPITLETTVTEDAG